MHCYEEKPVGSNDETPVVIKHPHIEYLYIQKCMHWECNEIAWNALWSIIQVQDDTYTYLYCKEKVWQTLHITKNKLKGQKRKLLTIFCEGQVVKINNLRFYTLTF